MRRDNRSRGTIHPRLHAVTMPIRFLARISAFQIIATLLCLAQGSHFVNGYSAVRRGAIIGHLEIPRLHMSVMVLEGSDPSILAVAAGHISGTSLPGTSGNVGIAAHRDTFFGSLREIRPNDIINLRTVSGDFSYAVNGTEVVVPTNIEVLHQTANAELTLVTCYPFRHKGPSPKRFIVHARRITDMDSAFSSAGQR